MRSASFLRANTVPAPKRFDECENAAGLSITDEEAEFKVKSISFVDGKIKIEWDPDLNESGTLLPVARQTDTAG